ncbi:7300_t:CDS:1, partial [Funneliformis caledonium]
QSFTSKFTENYVTYGSLLLVKKIELKDYEYSSLSVDSKLPVENNSPLPITSENKIQIHLKDEVQILEKLEYLKNKSSN